MTTYKVRITEEERQLLMKVLVENVPELTQREMQVKCNLLRTFGTADLRAAETTR